MRVKKTTYFDRLDYIKKLRAADFSERQAEAIAVGAQQLNESMVMPFIQAIDARGFATKADLEQLRTEVKADIEQLRTEVKADIEQLRTEVKADIEQLRTEVKADIEQLRTEVKADNEQLRTEFFSALKAEITAVRHELHDLEQRLTLKLAKLKHETFTFTLWLAISTVTTLSGVMYTLLKLVH